MDEKDIKFDRLEKKVDRMEGVLNDVKHALLGNEFNQTGIVHTIAEHHQRLNALERQLDRSKWIIIGLSAGSGVGIYETIKTLLS